MLHPRFGLRLLASLCGLRGEGSAATATRPDGDADAVELVSDRCRVDVERRRDLGERVAGAVAASGFAEIVVGHLAMVGSSFDASRLEVRGDGSSIDAERAGEIGECLSCPVLVDEFIDFGIGQATLHRSSGWV